MPSTHCKIAPRLSQGGGADFYADQLRASVVYERVSNDASIQKSVNYLYEKSRKIDKIIKDTFFRGASDFEWGEQVEYLEKKISSIPIKKIKGEEVKLDVYKGHVCIIVNVASQCGLTANNYKQLNELYEQYAESKGLRILAFPCNQFAGQEPGNPEEIHKQGGALGNFIKWNFTKFIIDKNGVPVERHGPNVDPVNLVKSLEKYW
ncbi:hypothetical protein MSG28_009591 [Choristoneura fumiferana]|uniref:Uncharacterized protein n=1 Tax=Choristoneura fumiferana TaxID=7141 RepID=A0ACC0JBR1_CHOFU|nr:hypothetical protein MSG28_009591 [Choristoneura fumiferana]